ncbi:unnamed protein product [Sphenostylis stenocarpa]|uniref:Uncharacterized protein n=1 Tax=Sphenostylis stenocarpa TaxID=92480 RepID=A0AA86ST97_9FABA|nr:unnamed protein product [Sphenostylis stenocarpa]
MATFRLIVSTIADVTLLAHTNNNPIPIRDLQLSPLGMPMNFDSRGTIMRSYVGTIIDRVITVIRVKDPAGILKLPNNLLSMVFAWTVENEPWQAIIKTPVDHIGRILSKDFSDSTCLTVHWLHGSEIDPSVFRTVSAFLIKQALFKHL